MTNTPISKYQRQYSHQLTQTWNNEIIRQKDYRTKTWENTANRVINKKLSPSQDQDK